MSMLTVKKAREDNKLTVSVSGRVDTNTAPALDNEVSSALDGVAELVLDLAQTEYVSSAGLRVIVSLYKAMNAKDGRLVLCGVNPAVMKMFIATGMLDFLEIV